MLHPVGAIGTLIMAYKMEVLALIQRGEVPPNCSLWSSYSDNEIVRMGQEFGTRGSVSEYLCSSSPTWSAHTGVQECVVLHRMEPTHNCHHVGSGIPDPQDLDQHVKVQAAYLYEGLVVHV